MWPVDPLRGSAVFITPGSSWQAELRAPDVATAFITEPSTAIAQQLSAQPCARLVISNHYLRMTSLPWSNSLEQPASGAVFLAARWRQSFGDAGADWALTHEPGAFENAGILLALPQALEQALQAIRADTLTVQPLISAAYASLARSLPKDCLFATLEPGCLALAVVHHGRIQTLSRYRVHGEWRAGVRHIHDRLLLQDPALATLGPIRLLPFIETVGNAASSEAFQLMPLSAPPASAALRIAAGLRAGSGFNLLPPRSRRSRLERRVLAAAAAVFLLAVGSWLQVGHSAAEAQPEMVATAPPTPLSARDKQELGREVTAVNKAVTALNLPADALVAALSPQQLKDVVLLNIDIGNAGDGKAHVVAAAKSIDGMESYLHLLEHRSDLASVNLLHHEIAESGDWPYRFTLEAQWQRP